MNGQLVLLLAACRTVKSDRLLASTIVRKGERIRVNVTGKRLYGHQNASTDSGSGGCGAGGENREFLQQFNRNEWPAPNRLYAVRDMFHTRSRRVGSANRNCARIDFPIL